MISRSKVYVSASLFFLSAPFFVYAASKLNTILVSVEKLLNMVIGVLLAGATIVFLWGMIRFIASQGDEKAKLAARKTIMWGIIGLAVMASAWGIANMLTEFIGIPSGSLNWAADPNLPH